MPVFTTQQAIDLTIEQYRDKGNLRNLLEAILERYAQVETSIFDLLTKRALDRAEGDMLDIWGEIIGYPRPIVVAEPEDIFTFENPSDLGLGFGSVGNSDLGGRFIGLGLGEGLSLAPDFNYRRRLRAQIVKNKSIGSIPDIEQYIAFVFDAPAVIEEGIGFVRLTFSEFIEPDDRMFIMQNLPVIAGVRVDDVIFGLDFTITDHNGLILTDHDDRQLLGSSNEGL
jgi:hypothetical protein